MIRIRLILAVGLCALMALPAIADARPGSRAFDATFPHASRLCQRADNGKLGPKLSASKAQVQAACTQLHSSFTKAQSDFRTAFAPIRQKAKDAIAQLRATCKQARANHDPASCRQARRQTRQTLRGLRLQARDAIRSYRSSIESARRTFWSTIRSLRGGSSETEDTHTSGPNPNSHLPSS